MRLNFSHTDLRYAKLAKTIDYMFNENQVEDVLYPIKSLTYNETKEEFRLLNFRALKPFLIFAGSNTNYMKLTKIVENHIWMILLIKRAEMIQLSQLLSDLKELANEDDLAANAARIRQFLNLQ